jgi:hypothetical protein
MAYPGSLRHDCVALLMGWVMGALGTGIVAACSIGVAAFTDGDGVLQPIAFGAIYGSIGGLFTGGPVFALVAVRRRMIHAWLWIFLPLCVACSLSGQIGRASCRERV